MEHFIPEEKAQEYIKLPKNFDWELIDQENGFAEIFSFIPQEVFQELKNSHLPEYQALYVQLEKAAALYSFILSIPRIKVHISNFGIEHFNQDKVAPAPWWDVRDLGLSMLKSADRLLSEAITSIHKMDIKEKIPFFKKANPYILTPQDFNDLFPTHNSPKVYQMLIPLMERAIRVFINEKLKPCAIEDIKNNEELSKSFREALAYYALYYASLMPSFVFLSNAVVVQYEELPWQKSLVLNEEKRTLAGRNFLKLADENIAFILEFIKSHQADFPCYVEPNSSASFPIKKKSGLYL